MTFNLFDFCEYRAMKEKQNFFSFPYLVELCEAIEDATFGNLPDGKKNLAVAIAPRHYKTTVISQCYPAWCLGEISPDCSFIMTSATSALASSNAIAVRRIIQSSWYRSLYPHVKIDQIEKDIQTNFSTTSKGSLYASGLGGTITGYGAGQTRSGFGGAIIIDDPIKPVEARSRLMLEKCSDYYTGTLKSRRNNVNNTPIILIMQRLHIDDLIGFVMQNEPDDWHLIQFPALDEQSGTVLNPMTQSLKELETLKEVDPSTYYSQYQQSPIIEGGGMIKPEWWRTYEPTDLRRGSFVFLTADTALKEDARNDASVIQMWLGTREGLYLIDGISGRWNFPTLLENAKEFWEKARKKYGAREFFIEDKASGTPLAQTMELAGIPTIPWNPSKYHYPLDKVGRMKTASFAVHGGKVFVPAGEEKVQIRPGEYIHVSKPAKLLIEEATVFSSDNSHVHDDFCDAFSMAHCIWVDAGGMV
jgi:predicted phage terminase large subunit-like protein